jgi:hypothetical protein
MTSARLPLSFSIDPACLFDTLETVLAIARRIDLRMTHLQLRGATVFIDLHASDADALALFRARLHNVIGVHDIVINVCMLPIGQKYRTLRSSHKLVPAQRKSCRSNPPSS